MKNLPVILLIAVLLVGGCATACKNITPERLDKLGAAMQVLQGGYDTSVEFAKANLNPSDKDAATLTMVSAAAKLALPLVDAGLKLLGQALESKCTADADLALTTAKAAAEAQQKLLQQAKEAGLTAS